ncbi:MAG: outer membrane beta-barrel protein [Magnetococcales bacterium]|nr:outer membrane beta-barrel protein [Magnetococcales bacterium]
MVSTRAALPGRWLRRGAGGLLLVAVVLVGVPGMAAPPKGLPIGIFRAFPKVTVRGKWEDNIYKADGGAQSDRIAIIEPTIQFVTHWRKNQLNLTVSGQVQRFQNHPLENREDHTLEVDWKVKPLRSLELNAGLSRIASHDERGAPGTGAVKAMLEPNAWLENVADGSAQYTSGRFRTVMKYGYHDKSSENNDLSAQNRHWNDLGLTLMYALAPKTALLTELGWLGYVYDTTPLTDSEERRLLTGVTWTATAKTEGELKVGVTSKDFADPAKEEATSLALSSNVKWKPHTWTTVNLSASRNFEEGEAGSGSYVNTILGADLEQQLRSWWVLTSNLRLTNSDYRTDRAEDLWTGGVGLEYRLPKWYVVGTEFSKSNKHSTMANSDYDSNALMLFLTGAL